MKKITSTLLVTVLMFQPLIASSPEQTLDPTPRHERSCSARFLSVLKAGPKFLLNGTANILATAVHGTGYVMNKTAKILTYGLLIQTAFATNLEMRSNFNTYQDGVNYYSGGPCRNTALSRSLRDFRSCMNKKAPLDTCFGEFSNEPVLDIYTRHVSQEGSQPVSKLQTTGGSKKICVDTALTPQSTVTRTCFNNLDNPTEREVKVMGYKMDRSHQGLNEGETKYFVSVAQGDNSCATTATLPSNRDLGNKPLCVFTSPQQGDTVTQFCMDPKNPSNIVVKPADKTIQLDFPTTGGPTSLVVPNAQDTLINTGSTHIVPTPTATDNPTPKPFVEDLPCPGNDNLRAEMEELKKRLNFIQAQNDELRRQTANQK